MIRATDRYGQPCALPIFLRGVFRCGVFGRHVRCILPLPEPDWIAERRETGEGDREVRDTAPLATARVQGERGVRASIENRLDQSGESPPRADLEEGLRAGLDHRLDLADEVDGSRELIREQLSTLDSRGRIEAAGAVGEDRDPPVGDLHRLERVAEGTIGCLDERAVERRRDFKAVRLESLRREQLPSPDDLRGRSREHALAWSIAVGEDDVEV